MGRLRPEEISSILKGAITDYENRARTEEVGQVLQVGDGIAQVHGLANAMYQEMVEFEDDRGETVTGLALSLEEDNVGVVIMGNDRYIREGSTVRRTGRLLSVPVGDAVLGRVINPLGEPMDDKGQIDTDESRPVEAVAPGIIRRQDVDTPMQTGIKAIDAMVPIGRGQRELILGDRKTGKTVIAADSIIAQRDTGVKCIYVAIAQKDSTVAGLVNTLEEHGAMDYTVVVNAPAHEEATFHYIAPYAGTAIGEYFMEQGEDALIIYDDLSKHANSYRQLMLLLRRPPGREAFPGDIFYLHSRLLERSARMADEHGGGSLTALPIGETKEGDISAYIPTNLISITDGQIFLDSDMFNSGQRPPIDVGNSVSRVGGDAQIKAMKDVTGTLRLDLAQYFELQSFAQFGSDLDEATQQTLARGERTMNMLQQSEHDVMPAEEQVCLIFAVTNGFLDDIEADNVTDWEGQFREHLKNSHEDLLNNIRETEEFSDEDEETLKEAIENFNESYEPETGGAVEIGVTGEDDEDEEDEEG
ncbi:MAG TPA: F0F1 ATP synthase subunit alpha [Rubrobacteraceae bacterium]|jgi:F-type H+-transporting ATPase subunit alpha|nr:F0F1 ATP synthase subunit alpha [Rubrobacteraceae bacterium]